MSEIDKQNFKKLEVKLKNLVDCILQKAASDSEFAQQLEAILLSDSLQKIVTPNKSKSKRNAFNAVNYLHERGELELCRELESKTDSELRQILQVVSNKKSKAPRNAKRQQIIEEIIENANRILQQGSSFL